VGQGEAFVPGVRLVEDLFLEYVEEEFFVSGTCVFSLSDRPLPPLLSEIRESVSHVPPAPAVW
jgi:hypothetical protein